MWNKKTKAEKQDLLIRAKLILDSMEQGKHPHGTKEGARIIRDFHIWNRLPSTEKGRIAAAWNTYYEDVKYSPIYLIVQEQRLAAAKGDWARVRDLAQQAQEMREDGSLITLPVPEFTDPSEFSQGSVISAYKKLLRQIEEMTGYPSGQLQKASVWNK